MKDNSVILCLFAFLILPTVRAQNLKYIENKGQWHENVLYKTELPAGSLFLEQSAFTFYLYEPKQLEGFLDAMHHPDNSATAIHPVAQHLFKINLKGANSNAKVVPGKLFPDYRNYYIGNNPENWVSRASCAQSVNYKNIYTGIDLIVYSENENFKYDFILQPEAEPTAIKLQYTGVDELYIKEGNLHINTSVNTLVEQQPFAYQVVNGSKQKVPCEFILSGNEVSFHFPEGYDNRLPLVIDPVLEFSTFSGSSTSTLACAATYDSNGNTYVAGICGDFGYNTTIGAYDTTYNQLVFGWPDIVISKFDATGANLLYATYLGGSSLPNPMPTGYEEHPLSIVVNSNDELLVLGRTLQDDFPTTPGAFDQTHNSPGLLDFIVSRFDPTGTTLLSSTFIGGSSGDATGSFVPPYSGEIITDNTGNVYVAASTWTDDFPTTPGCYQPNSTDPAGMTTDAVVFKMSPTLSSLVWSTYLGGGTGVFALQGEDHAYGLALDASNNVYVTGQTMSSDFPTTAGALNATFQGVPGFSASNGFVSCIKNDGTSLLYSTYLGSAADEWGYAEKVAVDNDGDVYVAGHSKDGNYPVINAAWYNPNAYNYIHKIDPTLGTTIYSGTFGDSTQTLSSADMRTTAFYVDGCENVYIAGFGGTFWAGIYESDDCSNLPVTSGAYRSISDGTDFWIGVFATDMDSLLYGTFFGDFCAGPTDHTDALSCRFAPDGTLYHSACADCFGTGPGFPTTAGAYSQTNATGDCNIAAFKFSLNFSGGGSVSAGFTTNPSPAVVCDTSLAFIFNNTSSVSGSATYYWIFGDGDSLTTASTAPVNHTYGSFGVFTVTLVVTDSGACSISTDTITMQVTVAAPPVANAGPDQTICEGQSVTLFASGGGSYLWNTGETTASIQASPASDTIYYVTVTNTCGSDIASIPVTVYPAPSVYAGEDTTIAAGSSVVLNGTGGPSWNWNPPDWLSCTNCQNPTAAPPQSTTYTLTVTDGNGCAATDSVIVILDYTCTHFIPNVFSPNGDGNNDMLYVRGNGLEISKFIIYDRWGEKVFKTTDPNQGWDGKFRSKALNPAVFVYYLEATCTSGSEIKEKGNVTLVR